MALLEDTVRLKSKMMKYKFVKVKILVRLPFKLMKANIPMLFTLMVKLV